MARSIKKGPYVDVKLAGKIEALSKANQKKVVKTWARRSTIPPDFVGHTIAVHNGKKFMYLLQKTWRDTNLVNLHLHAPFVDMAEKKRIAHA